MKEEEEEEEREIDSAREPAKAGKSCSAAQIETVRDSNRRIVTGGTCSVESRLDIRSTRAICFIQKVPSPPGCGRSPQGILEACVRVTPVAHHDVE